MLSPETLEGLSNRIASSLAALLGPDTPWLPTAEWVAAIIQHPNLCSDCGRPIYAPRRAPPGRAALSSRAGRAA
jgi:hypothetical protein